MRRATGVICVACKGVAVIVRVNFSPDQAKKIFSQLFENSEKKSIEDSDIRNAITSNYSLSNSTKIPKSWIKHFERTLGDCYKDNEQLSEEKAVSKGSENSMTKEEFVKEWKTSLESNRIGKIVFMGTPFLRKQWIIKQNFLQKISDFLKRMGNVLLALPLLISASFIFVYFGYINFVVGVASVKALLTISPSVFFSSLFTLNWNPLAWSKWVWCILLLIIILGSYIVFSEAGERKYNTNLYFDEKFTKSDYKDTHKLPVFVLTAKYLDEALLGLSSETIVYGNFLPRLKNLLIADFESQSQSKFSLFSSSKRIGKKDNSDLEDITELGRKIVRDWVVLPITRVIKLIRQALLTIVKPFRINFLLPRLTTYFIEVICSTAYGIPGTELEQARIEVKDKIDIPEFFNETHLDVTNYAFEADFNRELLSKDSTLKARKEEQDRKKERYAHIFELKVLENKQTELEERNDPNPWKNISEQVEDVYYNSYEPSFTLDNDEKSQDEKQLSYTDFRNQLARTWFTLEERLKEVTGSVELVHCLYYSNPKTVEEIAKFILKK